MNAVEKIRNRIAHISAISPGHRLTLEAIADLLDEQEKQIAELKQQVKNIASQLRFTDHIHEPQKPEKHWTDQVKENQKPEWKPTGHCADVDPPDSTTERAKCGGRCTNECIQS